MADFQQALGKCIHIGVLLNYNNNQSIRNLNNPDLGIIEYNY